VAVTAILPSWTAGNQTQVAYSYDNANRLTGITQGRSTVSFGYDNANRRTSLTLPNGIVMSYSYDAASQLTGIGYQLGQTNLGNLTYSYDLAGRRTSMGGSLAAVNLPNAVSTTAYNANNQLTQWGTATPTYDANGNTLSDGTNTYVWNARNQLASMNLTGDSFQYDPFGRRTAKTVLGTTTNYLYDGANPVQELSGTTPTANMLTGGVDEYFTRTDSTGTANFLTDALGSTVSLTNSSGGTLAQYTYEPFGNTTTTGSSTNTYQYTRRENDGTGVYFYRARYYSPMFQRFIAEDPSGSFGGFNFYRYAGDNPLEFTDPLGLDVTITL
jgi:RHS repeat-associated protein